MKALVYAGAMAKSKTLGPTEVGQWLSELLAEDVHAKRVLSLGNAVAGMLELGCGHVVDGAALGHPARTAARVSVMVPARQASSDGSVNPCQSCSTPA